jgi:hypothetical protein
VDFINHAKQPFGLGLCPNCTIYTAVLPYLAKARPPENPLFLFQKISAGKTSKEYAKGFSGGAQHGLPC